MCDQKRRGGEGGSRYLILGTTSFMVDFKYQEIIVIREHPYIR